MNPIFESNKIIRNLHDKIYELEREQEAWVISLTDVIFRDCSIYPYKKPSLYPSHKFYVPIQRIVKCSEPHCGKQITITGYKPSELAKQRKHAVCDDCVPDIPF